MARPIKVYVSCVQNELADERLAIKHSLLNLPLTVQWDFNFTSASSGRLSDEYLDQIWDCDLYLLLVGEGITDAVKKEYEVAAEAEKPTVALVKEGPRTEEAKEFVRGLKRKPRPRLFVSVEDLEYQVEAGVSDELIKCFKRLRLEESEMRELARRRVESIAEERRQTRDWKGSAIMMGILLIMVIAAVLFGRGRNTPPEIERVAADPPQVVVGESANLRVWAKDQGEGPLSYRWTASNGEIEQGDPYDNPSAIFHAPNTPGVVSVQVVVADTLGLEDEETIEIEVIQQPNPQ
jgi:hypothetical protein